MALALQLAENPLYNNCSMNEDEQKPTQGGEDAGWAYRPGGAQTSAAQAEQAGAAGSAASASGVVEWSASEYVAHEKGFGWYALYAIVAVLIIALLYFITKDKFSTGALLLMAIIFAVAAGRKPRVVTYRLDKSGLTVGQKFYPYGMFKSFRMPEDGPFTSVYLIPLRRFDFPVGAFLAPDSQREALEVLASHLPLERGEPGLVDQIMRQLRF